MTFNSEGNMENKIKRILHRLESIQAGMSNIPFSEAKAISSEGLKQYNEVLDVLDAMVYGETPL